MSDEPEREARSRALALLARREHSRHELRSKLERRGIEGEVLDRTLDALETEGLLSERRYVEQFVSARRARGQGPVRIAAELRARGIDEDLARASVDARADDWIGLARAARRKRFGAGAPADFGERARQSRFLEQRGFTGEQVRAALVGDAGTQE